MTAASTCPLPLQRPLGGRCSGPRSALDPPAQLEAPLAWPVARDDPSL